MASLQMLQRRILANADRIEAKTRRIEEIKARPSIDRVKVYGAEIEALTADIALCEKAIEEGEMNGEELSA